MTTVRELRIDSIAEPASVKIERNSKGYNYEIGYHGETIEDTLKVIFAARKSIELELYGVNVDAHPE